MKTLVIAIAMSAMAATAGFAAAALDPEMAAVLGKALFERDWVPAPASSASGEPLELIDRAARQTTVEP